ncbi:MAG: pyrroline-5-carboxylate reductase [Dehalococcoidia bacterium]|nr:pyrroline-5-carboxylate reductase [Dehalococcoidia bacterium]
MKIAFVGGGRMCESIVTGIVSSSLAAPSDISVGEPVEARRSALLNEHGVRVHADNAAAIAGAELVVLSVKPQSLGSVLPSLGRALSSGQALASIVAGARMRSIADATGHQAVIRVMPNTPAQIGAGISVWTAAPEVTDDQREAARSVVATLGEEVYVESEDLIDMATALSASGPAYVFTFVEALVDAGVSIGMSRDLAGQLAIETVLGSARMAKETGTHPAELRNMVTSPGGTTAAALLELERGRLRHTVMGAVAAAYRRSKELVDG